MPSRKQLMKLCATDAPPAPPNLKLTKTQRDAISSAARDRWNDKDRLEKPPFSIAFSDDIEVFTIGQKIYVSVGVRRTYRVRPTKTLDYIDIHYNGYGVRLRNVEHSPEDQKTLRNYAKGNL